MSCPPYPPNKKTYLAVGLMSGTSVDSIDAAAIRVELPGSPADAPEEPEAPKITLLQGISHPIPEGVRKAVFHLFEEGPQSLHRLTLLNMRLGELFAEAALRLLREAGLQASEVAVIGSHGQTVHHIARPEECWGRRLRGSLQIGEAAVIAQQTGIPVVADFRPGDIAAGGTGAPLAPFLDLLLFKDPAKDLAIQNIGGIGNVTWIPKGEEKVLAFDTGPGNMIVDLLVERYTRGKLHYDRDGRLGKEGSILAPTLSAWLEHPFLPQKPPKSSGREEFGAVFLATHAGGLDPSPDLIRTAEAFTALAIVKAYRELLPRMPERVIVTGGGAHNPLIMDDLADHLGRERVCSGNRVGIDVDYKEAMAFALLGLWHWLGRTNNLPEATGASRRVVLGKLSNP